MDLISNLDAEYKYVDIKNKLYTNEEDNQQIINNVDITKTNKVKSKKRDTVHLNYMNNNKNYSEKLDSEFLENQNFKMNLMTENVLKETHDYIEKKIRKNKIPKKNNLKTIDEDLSIFNIGRKNTNENKNKNNKRNNQKNIFFKKKNINKNGTLKEKINKNIIIIKKIIRTINYVLINNDDNLEILRNNNIFYYKKQNTALKIKKGNVSILYKNKNYNVNGLQKYIIKIKEEFHNNLNQKKLLDEIKNNKKNNLSILETLNFIKENKNNLEEKLEYMKFEENKEKNDNKLLLNKLKNNSQLNQNNFYIKIYKKNENRLSYGYILNENKIQFFSIGKSLELDYRILLLEFNIQNNNLETI